MQLQIKTLSNEKFAIECELSDTVRTIKEKIAAKDLKDKYEADAVKLIFSGKILEDSKTLEFYSITSDSFLVVVKQAPTKPQAGSAAAAAAPSNPSGAASAQTRTPTVATPTPAPAAPQQQPTRPAPASGTTPAASQDSFLSAESREKALRELTDMGFDRAQAELALRASFYHVERAAEYLITGNIPNISEPSAANPEGGSGQTPSGSESSTGGRRGGEDDLVELSQSPQFQALRQLIQQNPDQLQTLMQTLQATQPELFQLIEQRPQEFLELLNQADEGDDGGDDDDASQGGVGAGVAGGQGPPGTVTITLSPQDQQAINRLQDMGFERNRVIEAFLACDRNEELAANYLLSSFD
ncbi:unnamed protein product [Adineta ricciae]|uniref:UV excision repair protein RAD23 n=2 Tax=Adineta ricciae TaxID=249248 RepID=A0A814MN83_ADIRI|nr:unnamed protein product [Adineta ricciae]